MPGRKETRESHAGAAAGRGWVGSSFFGCCSEGGFGVVAAVAAAVALRSEVLWTSHHSLKQVRLCWDLLQGACLAAHPRPTQACGPLQGCWRSWDLFVFHFLIVKSIVINGVH